MGETEQNNPDRKSRSAPEQQRRTQELARVLLETLESGREPTQEHRDDIPPIDPVEFREVLKRLHEAGYVFDESYPVAQLTAHASRLTSANHDLLAAFQERYPLLPLEVGELVFAILTGHDPDEDVVGGNDERRAKFAAVEEFVMTEELRERFYLRRCGKVSRYRALDWEVVVKEVERGHRRSPRYPYALVTLDTANDVHGHHEHENVTFAIGISGLRTLVSEFSELLTYLEGVQEQLHGQNPATSKGEEK